MFPSLPGKGFSATLCGKGFSATLWDLGKMLSVRTLLVLSGENVRDSFPVAGEDRTVLHASFGVMMRFGEPGGDVIVGASMGKKPVSVGCRS